MSRMYDIQNDMARNEEDGSGGGGYDDADNYDDFPQSGDGSGDGKQLHYCTINNNLCHHKIRINLVTKKNTKNDSLYRFCL